MPDKAADLLVASDLPVVLYLNQRVTFDLLASLEGGFARLTTVQESSSDAKDSKLEGSAGLGIGNPFAFLGLTFGASGHRGTASTSSGTTTEELIHTPTSLFARLRKELIRRTLVKDIRPDGAGFDDIVSGDFVEFQAVLRRSPLVEALKTFRELVPMMEAFADAGEASATRTPRGQNAKGKQPSQVSQFDKRIDTLLQAVTADGSTDLVAECGTSRFVLTVEETYFVDPTMNDAIDGTFRIFGKVTRVLPADASAGISLLRKSALGNFGVIVEKLGPAFDSLADAGFSGPKVETTISPPTLQLIPIGIFT